MIVARAGIFGEASRGIGTGLRRLLSRVQTSGILPRRWRRPRPGHRDDDLATETPAEPKHAVLELASLLNAEVRMTEIILQALEARIVGLKVVRLGRLLVVGWVRGCARLMIVHSESPYLWAGLRGVATPAGPFLFDAPIVSYPYQ
jgi:hypothetical protein